MYPPQRGRGPPQVLSIADRLDVVRGFYMTDHTGLDVVDVTVKLEQLFRGGPAIPTWHFKPCEVERGVGDVNIRLDCSGSGQRRAAF